MIQVTCNRCGWVHMGVTREYVESRPPVDYNYERCFRCGNSYTDFRPALPDDCPVGSTIQPIIVEST